MNINESIRNKRKLVEKLRWNTFKITYISTAIVDDKHCTKIKLRYLLWTKMIKYTNYLICILMNINENIRNKRKLVEKLRGIPTKLPLHQLLTKISYRTWYTNKS